jgi:hypothetical protein
MDAESYNFASVRTTGPSQVVRARRNGGGLQDLGAFQGGQLHKLGRYLYVVGGDVFQLDTEEEPVWVIRQGRALLRRRLRGGGGARRCGHLLASGLSATHLPLTRGRRQTARPARDLGCRRRTPQTDKTGLRRDAHVDLR